MNFYDRQREIALPNNFLIFRFRFLHHFSYMTDIKAYRQLQDIVKRDYNALVLSQSWGRRIGKRHAPVPSRPPRQAW